VNIFTQKYKLGKSQRNQLNNHESFVIWITGLSGSGKSTIANSLDQALYSKSIRSFVLDGDNIRTGLNKDLQFSTEDRKENIRRIAEVAKLVSESGTVVITAFISPFSEDRNLAKKLIGEDNFVEVFIDCPIEECIKRDVKGLYKKAINGEIKDFTGINSPYEIPDSPDLHIRSNETSLEDSITKIMEKIALKLKL
jgi:adenylylsulfate kinase